MFWDIIDKISTILGLSAIVTFFYAANKYMSAKKAAKKRAAAVDELRKTGVIPSAVLAVSVGMPNIGTDVEMYIAGKHSNNQHPLDVADLKKKGLFFNICISENKKVNFIEEMEKKKNLKNNFLDQLDEELQKIYEMVKLSGVHDVYLFYCGPAILCAKIGAKFSNGCAVHLYHFQFGENPPYIYAGLLKE